MIIMLAAVGAGTSIGKILGAFVVVTLIVWATGRMSDPSGGIF